MDSDVPLVIPEVNPDHLAMIDLQHDHGTDGFIVTNPNCSTIMFAMALAPLRSFTFSDLRVATMQAISGGGFQGVAAMSIYDNVVPYIGGEEEKMESETLKIMGTFDGAEVIPAPFKVSASLPPRPGDRRTHDGGLGRHRCAGGGGQAGVPRHVPPISGLPTQP